LTTLLAIMKYMSRPKSAAVKHVDVDIDTAIFSITNIDIRKGDIDPPLMQSPFGYEGFDYIVFCLVF